MLVNIIQNTISSFISAGISVITTNLKMWLGFETSSIDGDKQITPDKSGNNNVGELFTGKALEFDGAGDNVGIDFTTPIKSAVFWVKPLDTGLENILSLGGAFGSSKYIRLNGNGIQTQGLSSVSIYVNGVQSSNAPLNQWSRVVVNFATVTPLELKFGYAFNSYGDIQLSDVQLYNENLSTDDITYDYANPQNLVTDRSGTSIGLSNLKGYWHLSEGAGSVAYDSSGEGNNGTINGATYEPAQPRIPQLGMMNWSKGSNLFPYSEDFTQWNVSSGGTITPNFALAPNGTQTATKYNIDGNFRVFLYTLNLSTSKEYTFSFYAKNISSTVAAYRVYDATNAANILVTSYLSELSTTDWTRIDVTFNTTSTGTSYNLYLMSGQGSGDILFWGAQLEESSSASAYRLTDGGATSNSTVIANPTIPSKDIFGNLVRDRLNSFNLGKFGGARVDDITLSGNQATIQLWFKNVNSNDSLYLADIHSSTDRIILGFNSSQLSVYHEITGSWQNFGVITDGDWNFATFTFDGTTLKCFVGTSQLGVTKTISAINIGTTEQFGIGMNHYFPTRTQDYNGHISDFLIYDRVLTSDEVENNYNAGLSAHTN